MDAPDHMDDFRKKRRHNERKPMIWKLDNEYRVVSDRHNFILQERTSAERARGRMKGRAKGGRWKDLGYWKQLDQVLREYTHQKLRTSSADGIEEVLSILAQVNAKIEGIGKQCITLWGEGVKLSDE